VTAASERPTARPRAPRAAPDEHIDPVASPAPVAAATPAAASQHRYGAPKVNDSGRKGSPEATVQLNSRISMDAAEIVDAAMRETGWTKRTVIEHAIRSTYET
jgi:hypothetical protein